MAMFDSSRRWGVAVTLLAAAVSAAFAHAQPATTRASTQPTLKIGDPAPPLKVERWLKGEPVSKFQRGTFYVVEFWATWCGPCIESIPDLTWLQKKYPQVVFIGVSVIEDDPSLVEPFVKRMGERMNYRVAADAFAGMDNGGPMWNAWMKAAGKNGIPCSFLIAADGTVADITHPMALRPTLEALLAGKPLPPKLSADEVDRVMALWKQYSAAWKRKDWDDAQRILEALGAAEYHRRELLIGRGDYAAAQAMLDELDRRIASDDVEPSEISAANEQRLRLFAKQGDAVAMNRLAATIAKQRAGDAQE